MKYVNPSGLTHLAFLSHSRDPPSSPGLHEYQSVVTKMRISTLVSYEKTYSIIDRSHFSGYVLLPLHFPSSIHFSFGREQLPLTVPFPGTKSDSCTEHMQVWLNRSTGSVMHHGVDPLHASAFPHIHLPSSELHLDTAWVNPVGSWQDSRFPHLQPEDVGGSKDFISPESPIDNKEMKNKSESWNGSGKAGTQCSPSIGHSISLQASIWKNEVKFYLSYLM